MMAIGTSISIMARLSSGRGRAPRTMHRLDGAVGHALDLELVVGRSSTSSPGAGRWPSASVTIPPTVAASVSHVVSQQRRGIVDGHAAGQAHAPVGKRLGCRIGGLELVADVAEQLRQHVLERQQAGGAAELVDDQRLMRAPLAKLAQDAIGGDALVDASASARIRSASVVVAALGDEPAHEVLRVQDADDVVDRVAVDGQPRVRALRDDADDLVERRVDVERGDLAPRHHQLLGLTQIQPQRALQPAMLVGLEQSAVAALGDEQLDLVRRVDVPVGLIRRAHEAQEQQRRCRSAT